MVAGSAGEIPRLLRSNELDLALLTLPIVAPHREIRPVLKEEMVVVTVSGHPLTCERHMLDEFFLEPKIPANLVMETENVEIIRAMVPRASA